MGQKELSVSMYQAIVLLLFNDTTEIPFVDIKLYTGIGQWHDLSVSKQSNYFFWSPEDAELRCTLQSLACGKKRVLKKRPPGKDVDDNDVFVLNDAFEDPRSKVHINAIQVKETVCIFSLPFETLSLNDPTPTTGG